MNRRVRHASPVRWLLPLLVVALAVAATAAAAFNDGPPARTTDSLHESVLRGRGLVIAHGCGDCHGGMPNPASEEWLIGKSGEGEAEVLGPFSIYARNLTPDAETGLGGVSERQIFNALRYGLRPSRTPDVEITSAVPGEGNHPANGHYLAPAMPWLWFRYMTDQELRDIAAYLKHGLNPVRHQVPEPQGPPDHWAGEYAPEKIGPPELPPFPTAHEELRDEARREQVLQGRHLVGTMACSACHGGALHPGQDGWLSGTRGEGPLQVFEIGPFTTRPRNLTPDNTTGMGRFTERQIFNALRFGLRPGETPDIEITSTVPGEGNHPVSPKYMAIPMPWPAWRHLSDEELWAMAAYLKHGVRPVSNRVADSEGPPDFWASEYTVDKVGPWPAAPFPTARERQPAAAARQ
jgi:mono/diheme cytochrome c family protein